MPSARPDCMADWSCAGLSSRTKRRTALLPTMISKAATRPPPSRRTSLCETTACRDSASMERAKLFSPGGNISTTRLIVPLAEGVCRVPSTRCPVSAAVRARLMVS